MNADQVDWLTVLKEFGLPTLIAVYFLVRDWRFTAARIEADKALAAALAALTTTVEMLRR